MSQQRLAEIRTAWEFAFNAPLSDDAVVRLGGWCQAFGTLPLNRAIERVAAAGPLPENEAVEAVRLTLRQWKSRGWL